MRAKIACSQSWDACRERDSKIRDLLMQLDTAKNEVRVLAGESWRINCVLKKRDAQIAQLSARVAAYEKQYGDDVGVVSISYERCPCAALRARVKALEAEVAYREEEKINQLLVTDMRVKALEALIRSREYITDPKGKAPVFCPWCDSRPHAENCKAKEVLDA